jgi:hypothetical protein
VYIKVERMEIHVHHIQGSLHSKQNYGLVFMISFTHNDSWLSRVHMVETSTWIHAQPCSGRILAISCPSRREN